MKFEKDMKEWNMFGELYALLKKCTMEHMSQKKLWALCVEFGQKYSEEGDFDSLSYQLACDLYSYSLFNNRTSSFTFGNDSEEKKMFMPKILDSADGNRRCLLEWLCERVK